MKITLDLTSVLVGGAVALALGVVVGFSPQVTSVPGASNVTPQQTTGAFSPFPADMFKLEALASVDSPIVTVPNGRVFVVTGASSSDWNLQDHRLLIDGQLRTFSSGTVWFPSEVPFFEGQTIQLLRTNAASHQWLHGYWADA
ncbi:hypothetical protein N9F93_00625 [bacterium]|nr:hypothetical protein [bacterium]